VRMVSRSGFERSVGIFRRPLHETRAVGLGTAWRSRRARWRGRGSRARRRQSTDGRSPGSPPAPAGWQAPPACRAPSRSRRRARLPPRRCAEAGRPEAGGDRVLAVRHERAQSVDGCHTDRDSDQHLHESARHVHPAQRRSDQCDRVTERERGDHPKHTAAGREQVGAPPPAAGDGGERRGEREGEQEQEVIGPLQDVLEAVADHVEEPACRRRPCGLVPPR